MSARHRLTPLPAAAWVTVCLSLCLSGCALWPASRAAQTSVSLSDSAGIARPAWLAEQVAAMDAAAYGAPIRLKLSYELTAPPVTPVAQADGVRRF